MALKYLSQFTINVLDKRRSLFSIQEDSESGNILLGLRAPYPDAPDFTQLIAENAPKIREHRFSIHPSPTSPQQINVIKHTRLLEFGEPVIIRHYTKAIKNGDRFAVVFCRRCADLLLPVFIPSKTLPKDVSLGSLDHLDFSLVYIVVVSAKGLEFAIPDKGDVFESINLTFLECKNIRITVLWTFFNIPAHNSFQTRYFTTVKPTNADEEERMLGLSSADCTGHFITLCTYFVNQLFERLKSEKGVEMADYFRRNIEYFRNGLTSDPYFHRHMTNVNRKELLLRLLKSVQNLPG